ncbi:MULTISPECIES: beta-galactosidase [Marinimicrobium]|uniref:beta-galactosidase n=1 Tax=Marinimicrobium TaxID=359337 RepID=UPI00042785A4|nr:beta-galactosidase [Marinimicrobium agarilyticum]
MPSKASIGTALALGLTLGVGTGCAPTQDTADDTQRPFTPLQSIADFNATPPSALYEDSEGTRSELHSTDSGEQQLHIRFSPKVYKAAVTLRPENLWDWSDFNDFHLAMDAHNPGNESVQLWLGITDASGAVRRQSVNLAAGESGTYYVVLNGPFNQLDSGLRENPPPWDADEMFYWRHGTKDLDLSQIQKITLFVEGNLTEKVITVDDIRLRQNPAYSSSHIQQFVDRFGQNATVDYPIKIHSESELKRAAKRELEALESNGPMADRSRFGGWKDGPRYEATGYFRTKKVDGKWWLVDPEGYLFFSNGLANVRMANLTTLTGVDFRDPSVREVDPDEVTPEDSIGIVELSDEVRQTRYVASSLRHDMFNWLPEYDHPLSDHYSYRRSVHKGPMPSGETFSFYRANLERRYGEQASESYVRQWEDVTLDRMQSWGFTSMGNWVDPAFYPNEQVPYFANGWIIGDFATLSSKHDVWAPMPDPFDPEFVRRAKVTIDVIAEETQGSPWCIGVFIDNEKSWGRPEGSVSERYGIILDALSQPAAQSPAKQAFTRHLKKTYKSIAQLNERWGTSLASWDALAEKSYAPSTHTDAAVEDYSTLLALLSEEYFRVVHNTLEAALPNHLYMGVRMASWGMPDETVEASIKYSDVLSFNIYDEGVQPHAWDFLNEIDLPSIIGEFHIGATRGSGLLHPGLVMADDLADRAEMYKRYMESVAAHDTMVGAHWFQYVDSPITGRAFDGENYNVGFVSVTDIPYPNMVEAARSFNKTLYPKRFNDQ